VDDDLGDALIFNLWACTHRTEHSSIPRMKSSEGEQEITFYLFVETVKQTLLGVLRDDFERGGQKKVTHVALDFFTGVGPWTWILRRDVVSASSSASLPSRPLHAHSKRLSTSVSSRSASFRRSVALLPKKIGCGAGVVELGDVGDLLEVRVVCARSEYRA